MRTHLLATTALTLALLVPTAASAQSPNADQPAIYGSQLMTPQERQEYRQRMQSATSATEKAEIRAGHHEVMQQRAQQMGKTLPDQPPAQGMGAGQGRGARGMGQGMGPKGGGRGPGG